MQKNEMSSEAWIQPTTAAKDPGKMQDETGHSPLIFQGRFQVCDAFHCGGNRRGHIDGRAAEDDACCARVQGTSVFIWGKSYNRLRV